MLRSTWARLRVHTGLRPPKPVIAAPRARDSAVVTVRRFTALHRSKASLQEAELVPVTQQGELTQYPDQPGVYAVYDQARHLQYVGLTLKISGSIALHMQQMPGLTSSVRFQVVEGGSREDLRAAWKAWMEQAIAEHGIVPPGNMPGETLWAARPARSKPEIKLTAGKAINVPIETLVDDVVKSNKVVAFVKGTRVQPQCGFSYKMLQMLNDIKADYEVVNVLDEFHNPGLREAIKAYSQWPTIPQLYIDGEFVGGSDICEQMVTTGQLQQMLRS